MYERFAELLKNNDITPYRISKDTGISQATLSDWKTGKSNPKIDKIILIANYFGVSVNYFLKEDEERDRR